MRKQLPIFLGFLAGAFAFAEFYIPAKGIRNVQSHLLEFAQVLASAAFILGGINIIQVAVPAISKRRQDWGYKLVLVLSAAAMLLVGIAWHDFGAPEGTATITQGGAAAEASIVVVPADADVVVTVNDRPLQATDQGYRSTVPPGEHTVKVVRSTPGYTEYKATFRVAAGQVATVRSEHRMLWGTTGRAYTWLYDYVFAPCNATMFALLAFFIASAAFRAFRARNAEAALLLGAAILVMLGRVPIGAALGDFFPSVAEWLVQVINNAGRRAIMIGAALGAIATSLRVILGLERTHLGRD